MFGPTIDSLKKENFKDITNTNKSYWVLDTAASEHVTKNKELLRVFKELKLSMKCTNNSCCIFEGYGTFFGMINNHQITLHKVYSKNINKNIISVVKLAKAGINVEICNNDNESINILLKNNNKDLIEVIQPDDFNIPRICLTNKNNELSINAIDHQDHISL